MDAARRGEEAATLSFFGLVDLAIHVTAPSTAPHGGLLGLFELAGFVIIYFQLLRLL